MPPWFVVLRLIRMKGVGVLRLVHDPPALGDLGLS
jgi:hypothetical protein